MSSLSELQAERKELKDLMRKYQDERLRLEDAKQQELLAISQRYDEQIADVAEDEAEASALYYDVLDQLQAAYDGF